MRLPPGHPWALLIPRGLPELLLCVWSVGMAASLFGLLVLWCCDGPCRRSCGAPAGSCLPHSRASLFLLVTALMGVHAPWRGVMHEFSRGHEIGECVHSCAARTPAGCSDSSDSQDGRDGGHGYDFVQVANMLLVVIRGGHRRSGLLGIAGWFSGTSLCV